MSLKFELRNARPFHYAVVGAQLLVYGSAIAVLRLHTALGVVRATIIAACAYAGARTFWLAITGYRVGAIRTGFGLIERAENPAAFWAAILLAALFGPLSIVALEKL